MNNNKNVLLAIGLAAAVLFAWQYFVANPSMKAEQAHQAALSHEEKAKPAPAPQAAPPALATPQGHMSREAALKAGGARVTIDTPMVDGSIQLTGARMDDLRLKKYHETVDPRSPEIVLLAPKNTAYPYYAEFGWVGSGTAVPNDGTVWKQTGGSTLAPGHPVTLSWDNGRGLVFTRVIGIDDKYMFTVSDSVANKGNAPVKLYPYAYVARQGVPKTTSSWLLHEGFIGVANGSAEEAKYDDFKDPGTPPKAFNSSGGWVGITDKYWMAAIVPPQDERFSGEYRGAQTAAGEAYQANYRLNARALAPGATVTVTHRLFAGAKVVDVLKSYQDRQHIAHFDLAVDWGYLFFITRPLFWLLDTLYKYVGNFGLAILGLTVVVKLLFFPLANAGFRSMSKMKKVQPEMQRLKEAHGDDPAKLQQHMMELYRREKVNPVSGCLPILIQIPVFFALYKVLYVTIEMRHAPFYGWIHDLSAPDPTSVLNLFGLLPYNPAAFLPHAIAFLSIGAWPILYGITQWVQTKLNPPPADPIQAKMFSFMPVIFTFMFATFPAGLVIYYCWNNLLTVVQQYIIMRREGVEVMLFDNIKPKRLKAAND
jgi:YidC/Oxa1 family membrane protein insertase